MNQIRSEAAFDTPHLEWLGRHSARHVPLDVFEALLVAAPHEEPADSLEERHGLREVVADAVDRLSEEDRWMIEMLCIAKLSLRFVGRILGVPKTSLARKRDRVLATLRADLVGDPLVREHLGLS